MNCLQASLPRELLVTSVGLLSCLHPFLPGILLTESHQRYGKRKKCQRPGDRAFGVCHEKGASSENNGIKSGFKKCSKQSCMQIRWHGAISSHVGTFCSKRDASQIHRKACGPRWRVWQINPPTPKLKIHEEKSELKNKILPPFSNIHEKNNHST